jgi:hypothetical protein
MQLLRPKFCHLLLLSNPLDRELEYLANSVHLHTVDGERVGASLRIQGRWSASGAVF